MITQFSLKQVFVFLLSVSILTSCTKDNPKPPETNPQPAGNLLHKVTLNETDSLVFEYAANGTLQKITSTEFEVGSAPAIFNFQYNGSGDVKTISSNAGARYEYIYEGNRLKMIENYLDNKKVSENNFVWTSNKISSNTVFTGTDQGNGSTIYRPTFKATYQYDGAGLLKKLSTFTVNALTNEASLINERVIDQVDNKINPLKILEPINLVSFSEISMPNNILAETLYDKHGAVEENTVNSFVFDNQGRVKSAVSNVSEPGHSATSIQVKYYYK